MKDMMNSWLFFGTILVLYILAQGKDYMQDAVDVDLQGETHF